jgi:SAM-dependent methyltransferase
MEQTQAIHEHVRRRYAKAASGDGCCGTSGCCGVESSNVETIALEIGYKNSDLLVVPDGANLGLGCGNPVELADIQQGETVLDLGSGAGFDAFLAARLAGPTGKVIGVDMTPEMISKARANARTAGYTNVEFRPGLIEDMPVETGSVDVVISNCVINLSPDKSKVFAEAYRVLKPGGRMLVSDLVLTRELSPALSQSIDAWTGCVAGAALKETYLKLARDAGFSNVEIVDERKYDVGLDVLDDDLRDEAFAAVASVKVRGKKG